MKTSVIIALFIFIALPFSGLSEARGSGEVGPYTHFYCSGYFTPGSAIIGKFVGEPWTQPVGLFIGASMFNPAMNTQWGNFYIDSYILVGPWGYIPSTGVMELNTKIPMTAGPYSVYIQAMIGNELTNLFVMDVRGAAPSGMVLIPGGAYEMGDHHDYQSDALPAHEVNIDTFLMDIHEVTNHQYCDFLNAAYADGSIEIHQGVVCGSNGSDVYEVYCRTTTSTPQSRITWNGSIFGVTKGKFHHPMVHVSWYGAAAYANWLSIQDGLTPCYNHYTWVCDFNAGGYRLPTEAEWEKATRGGEHNPYHRYPWGGFAEGSNANYGISGDPYENGASPCTTPVQYYNGNQVPSGVDMANGYGLYDMAGNVYEWCNDFYDSSYYSYCVSNGITDNPKGPASGTYRVFRGGGWNVNESTLRCASRFYHEAYATSYCFGFRLVKD